MEVKDIIRPENLVYKRTPLLTDANLSYCPGCGHGTVHRLIMEVVEEMGIQEDTIGIAPVGCSVLAYDFMDIDCSQAAHGRAPAVAGAFEVDAVVGHLSVEQAAEAVERHLQPVAHGPGRVAMPEVQRGHPDGRERAELPVVLGQLIVHRHAAGHELADEFHEGVLVANLAAGAQQIHGEHVAEDGLGAVAPAHPRAAARG